MMEVTLEIKIPDSWVSRVQAKDQQPVPIHVLDCMPYGEEGGRGLIQIDAASEAAERLVDRIRAQPDICQLDFAPVKNGGVFGSVALEKCVACRALCDSNCFLISALARGNGSVEWQLITGAGGALRDLIKQLEHYGCEVSLKRSVRLTKRSELTSRQEEIIKIAYDQGYYATPKKITVRKLAKKFGIAPSTLNEILQRAERKIIGHYFSRAE